MSHLAIHFLLLTPLLLLATVSNGLNTSSAATADTDNQLLKNVKKLAVGIDSITSKMGLDDGVRTLADADVGPVLALVPLLARALLNAKQWSRVVSGSDEIAELRKSILMMQLPTPRCFPASFSSYSAYRGVNNPLWSLMSLDEVLKPMNINKINHYRAHFQSDCTQDKLLDKLLKIESLVVEDCKTTSSKREGMFTPCLVQLYLESCGHKRAELMKFVRSAQLNAFLLGFLEVLCTTGNQPNTSNVHTIFPLMHLTAIAEGLPMAVEQSLESSWPEGIRNTTIQEVVGNENITDGNHTGYQEIAEHIAAAAVKRGSDGFGYHVLVASAWPGPEQAWWWPWAEKYATFTSAASPVCIAREWCTEMRDHQGIHVVIVRFPLIDDIDNSSKNRFAAANDWINKNNKTIQGMGDDLYTENDLDQVMAKLDTRLNNTLGLGVPVPLSGTPLFRAVVPVRFYGDQEAAGLSAEMPVKHGLATVPRGAGQILKMGGVCKRWFGRYFGLRIFFFP